MYIEVLVRTRLKIGCMYIYTGMCDGHLLLPYYSEITSGVDPIHFLHPWSEGLFIREVVPGSP